MWLLMSVSEIGWKVAVVSLRLRDFVLELRDAAGHTMSSDVPHPQKPAALAA